jgi:hypothetical protein
VLSLLELAWHSNVVMSIHGCVPSSGPRASSFLSSSTLILVWGAKAAFFVGRSPPWSFLFRFFSAMAVWLVVRLLVECACRRYQKKCNRELAESG